MAFNLRIYSYDGMIQVQQVMVKQFNSDSVFLLNDPYLTSELLVVNGATPISSTPTTDRGTILHVEVPDGQQIRYEVNPLGPSASNARVAGNLSPRLSGFTNLPWGRGYSLSVCDAASFL